MKTASAVQPYDLQQLGVVLAENGLIKRGEALSLDPYEPAYARRRKDRRWHYRVSSRQQTLCHLVVGTHLAPLYARVEGFFKACPKLVCRPLLFWEQADGLGYLCLEHFPGQSLDAAVQAGQCTAELWLAAVRNAQDLLMRTAQPATSESLQREVHELIGNVSAFPGFSSADTMLLREAVQPLLINGSLSEKLMLRWSNGDFVGRNLLINEQGEVRLIDYEYAGCTHYGQGDWLRLIEFSTLPKPLDFSSIKELKKARKPWLEIHLWLHHLSHLKNVLPSSETKRHVARSISQFFIAVRSASNRSHSASKPSFLLDSLSGHQTEVESLLRERTAWAASLDTALAKARAAHSEKAKLAEERTAWAQKLNAQLKITREENKRLQAKLTEVIDPAGLMPPEPPLLPAVAGIRKILLHFHIFKNAGSTLDAALEKNLGDAWMPVEGDDTEHHMDWRQALKFIKAHPGVRALSSHTLRYPPPARSAGIKILPLLLIRHPIDRLASIYYFERGNLVDSHSETSRIARKGSLADFIHFTMIKRPELGCDTQTSLIARSGTYRSIPKKKNLDAARLAIKGLPVPGVVEKMDQYLVMLETEFSPILPNLDLACPDENRNAERAPSLLTRLRKIRAQLPPRLWLEFRQRNRLDLELWRFAHRLAKARFAQIPEAKERLADFLRRKALAQEAALVSTKLLKKAKHAQSSEKPVPNSGIISANDPQAYALLQDAYSERLIWAKSLEKALRSTQANFAALSKEHAERTTWAKSLDTDLKKARALLDEQTKLVEERSAWAKSLETDLQKSRATVTEQGKLIEQRSAWGKSLDAELQKTRAALAQQSKLFEERSDWAKSLDIELKKTRSALGEQAKLVEERSIWAKSLEADLRKARDELTLQSKLVKERTVWGKSLEEELLKTQANFGKLTKEHADRSVWAKTLDSDLQKARAALALQTKLVEERSAWGKSLDAELVKTRTALAQQSKLVEERSVWAKSLDAELKKARAALVEQTALVEERSAWAKSLGQELLKAQANFDQLSREHAERSAWAKSLDTDLHKTRTALAQQSKLVEERSVWARSLDVELKTTRAALVEQSKLLEERSAWGKSLELELRKAQAHFEQLSKEHAERSAWAKSLDADLQKARTTLTQQSKLVEERSAWGKSLEKELLNAQNNFKRLSEEHAERSIWAQSLDTDLQKTRTALVQQTKFVEERSVWARTLDAELQEARAAHARQTALVEERLAWAKSLEQELRSAQVNFDRLTKDYAIRSAWATSLEAELAQSRAAHQRLHGEYAERTAWAMALDAELQNARGALAQQTMLAEERSTWAQSLEAELRSAQSSFADLTREYAEHSVWAKSLDAELTQSREAYQRLQGEYAERTAWARSLEAEVQQIRGTLAQQTTLIDDRTVWAQSLENELRSVQGKFDQLTRDYAERSAWATSLDAEISQTREAYQRLHAEFDERTAWALSMDSELQKLGAAYQNQTQIMTHLSEERDSLATKVNNLTQLAAKLEGELKATRAELARYETRLICRLAARRGSAK